MVSCVQGVIGKRNEMQSQTHHVLYAHTYIHMYVIHENNVPHYTQCRQDTNPKIHRYIYVHVQYA